MTNNNRIHKGSLQFYPRVRAKKVLPRVNWSNVNGNGLQGFVGYKVGMISVWAKDDTENSLTKGKRIAVPATVLECPALKIYSVRFYKNGKVFGDVVVSGEKNLKGRVRLPKEVKAFAEKEGFEDVRIVVYSEVSKTGLGQKKPNMIELAIGGSVEEKMNFIKERIGKEILVSEVLGEGLVDVRGVTKGFGTCGPVKRFGIGLKDHKSEKGRRRPGSIGAFGLRRVNFRSPQAGQTGYQNRMTYNNLIMKVGKVSEEDSKIAKDFHKYGKIKTDFVILKGSVPGPTKRALVITPAMKPSKFQNKKKLEVLEIR